MEEEAESVSAGDIFRTIKRKIWYILGATVLFTVAMALIIEFAVNPRVATYSMEFRLVFPSEGSEAYPDGSPFFYQDMISTEFLAEAKNSSDALSGVNTDKMYKNGDITIEAEKSEENGFTEYTGRYNISVKSSYFKSGDQAEQFIEAIAGVPVARMRAMAENVNYASDKDIFESAPFEERIALLVQERENLLSVYDSWIAVYSETYRVGGRRLKDYRDSVSALFGGSVRAELESELEFGGYYSGDLDTYAAQLRLEYDQNSGEIRRIGDLLKGSPADAVNSPSLLNGVSSAGAEQQPDLSQRLAELIRRNTRIAHWIGIVETVKEDGTVEVTQDPAKGTLQEESVARFAARLSEEFEKLNAEAEQLTEVISSIYTSGMSVRFDAQKVASSGDVNMIVAALGSFIGGFLIACVVAYAVESGRKKGGKRGG